MSLQGSQTRLTGKCVSGRQVLSGLSPCSVNCVCTVDGSEGWCSGFACWGLKTEHRGEVLALHTAEPGSAPRLASRAPLGVTAEQCTESSTDLVYPKHYKQANG